MMRSRSGRPLANWYLRATLMAHSIASAPELQKNTRSAKVGAQNEMCRLSGRHVHILHFAPRSCQHDASPRRKQANPPACDAGIRDQLWMTRPRGALGKEHVDEHMPGLLRASHGI